MKELILYSTIGIILLYAVIVNFLALYPVSVLELKDSSLPVLNENKKVKKGEPVIVLVDFCKKGNHPAVSRARLAYTNETEGVGNITIEYSIPKVIHSHAAEGCRTIVLDAWIVPSYVSPNMYVLIIETEYTVNIFQKKTVTLYSEPFEVIN